MTSCHVTAATPIGNPSPRHAKFFRRLAALRVNAQYRRRPSCSSASSAQHSRSWSCWRFPKHNNRRHRGIYATEMSDIDGIFVKYSIVLHGVSAARRGALRDLVCLCALCLSCFVAWSSCESSLRAYLWSGDAFSQEAPPQRDSQTQHNCQREWDSAVCGKPRLWLSPPQYCSSFHSETSTCSRR